MLQLWETFYQNLLGHFTAAKILSGNNAGDIVLVFNLSKQYHNVNKPVLSEISVYVGNLLICLCTVSCYCWLKFVKWAM